MYVSLYKHCLCFSKIELPSVSGDLPNYLTKTSLPKHFKQKRTSVFSRILCVSGCEHKCVSQSLWMLATSHTSPILVNWVDEENPQKKGANLSVLWEKTFIGHRGHVLDKLAQPSHQWTIQSAVHTWTITHCATMSSWIGKTVPAHKFNPSQEGTLLAVLNVSISSQHMSAVFLPHTAWEQWDKFHIL